MSSPEPEAVPLPSLPESDALYLADPRDGGVFHNPWGVSSGRPFTELLRWQLGPKQFGADKKRPPEIPAVPDAVAAWAGLPSNARVQWLGHATVLVEIDGVRVITDPLLGRAGVVPRAHPAPYSAQTLPDVDVVLLTHGHRDHFDTGSLKALGLRFPDALFCVPVGLARSLPAACRRRVELSWWQRVVVRGVELSFVPAQHWHMRTPFDRNKALWGGWVLKGRDSGRSVYHSGDTGYFGGFGTIGRVFPEIDVAVLPLGAYEPRWFMGTQHMAPEESVQCLLDLGAKRMMGMHWGTFDLTDEPLDHGAFTLLPGIVEEHGVGERVHVLAHGDGLGLG